MRRNGWAKHVGYCGAFALLLGASVAPLADARLEAAAARGTTHVESRSGPQCPPAHDHATCQLCLTLRIPGVRTGAVVAWQNSVPATTTPLAAPIVASASRFRSTQHSRAPPLA